MSGVHRWQAGILVPLSAAGVVWAGLCVVGASAEGHREWSMPAASAVGAFAGSALVHRHFGLPGWHGWGRAALAFAVALFVGGVAGGALLLGGYGAVYGPIFVAGLVKELPAAFLVAPFLALRLTARLHARRHGLDQMPAPSIHWLGPPFMALFLYTLVAGLLLL